ncbi:MAG: transporter substrate-binding domain-containing protein [Lentisphaeria bacterium]|nr:transporter substrate-binding domain-containing protein [Lentisphaeria bacterium]
MHSIYNEFYWGKEKKVIKEMGSLGNKHWVNIVFFKHAMVSMILLIMLNFSCKKKLISKETPTPKPVKSESTKTNPVKSARKNNYSIVTSNLPPWSMHDRTEKIAESGIFVDITNEIEKRLGSSIQARSIPWERAQNMTQESDNHIIFPLTRTESREDKYTWIIKVMPQDLVFANFSGKALDLKSATDEKLILVHKESPPNYVLRSNKFTNMHETTDGSKQIVKMLLAKRADTWFSAKSLIQYSIKNTQLEKRVKYGPPIKRGVQYIAASKDMPEDIVLAYRKAFKELEEKGIIQMIFLKYLGAVPEYTNR